MFYIQFLSAGGNWYGANAKSLHPMNCSRKTRAEAISAAMHYTIDNNMRYRVILESGAVVWDSLEPATETRRLKVRPYGGSNEFA